MPAKRKTRQEKPQEVEKVVAEKKARRVSHPSYERLTNGTVLTLGQGDVGQLGLGDEILERKRPALVKDLEGKDIVQVVCGGMHTVALSSNGELFTWGCNDEGALGRVTNQDNGEEYRSGSVQLNLTSKVVQTSAGDSHTAALLEDGNVYAWGTFRDANGAIGLTPNGQSNEPIKVYPTLKTHGRAVKITSGNDHVAILTENGEIYTFGSGEQGQLGRIKECFSHRGGRRGLPLLLVPQVIKFRKKHKFTDIFSGSFQTFAVSGDSNDVYAWGLNNWGQLGAGNTINHFTPIFLDALTDMRKDCGQSMGMAGGQHHSVIVNGKGKVYSVGRSEYGRLGHGDNAEEISVPKQVTENLENHNVKEIACGETVSFAITKNGDLFAWGLGSSLQLGNGSEDDVLVPMQVKGKFLDPSKQEVICVSAGGQHTAILIKERPQNPNV